MSTYGTTTPLGDVAQSTSAGTQVADRDEASGNEVAQKVSEVSADAKDHAKDLMETAAEQAKSVTSEVRDKAGDLVSQTRSAVSDEVGNQAGRFATSIDDYAQQLITMASRADNPDDAIAQFVRQAGDRMQGVARRLQQGGPEAMLADVKRFARQRPGLFVLGAVGAGFVAGRLLRNVDKQAIADAAKGEDTSPVSTTGRIDLTATTPSSMSAPGASPMTGAMATAASSPATAPMTTPLPTGSGGDPLGYGNV
jgi:ElaB/YqjD/DUF883 family membrane-anchored ribosome-binding protein